MNDWNRTKIGILGGGQLGRMLGQPATQMNLHLETLDPLADSPAAGISTRHTQGDFKDYQTVLDFGKDKDILSVEIEAVAVDALSELEEIGVKVYPQTRVLKLIKDKGLQKQFYQDQNIPTTPFALYNNVDEVLNALEIEEIKIPFVQKSRTDGYDGQGVRVIRSKEDLEHLLKTPCLIEDLCDVKTELSVIVARNAQGEIKTWDAVEMIFDPRANLIDFLCYPARISPELAQKAQQLALQVIDSLDMVGLLAVEMFLDSKGQLLVNEVAPRPHNSGHQTIESSMTSQYEQHLRAILNLPLGSTDIIIPSVMLNLTGEPGHSGPALFAGFAEVLAIPGVKVHHYGKEETRPFRKMGHVTVLDKDIEIALSKAKEVKSKLKVIAK